MWNNPGATASELNSKIAVGSSLVLEGLAIVGAVVADRCQWCGAYN